MVKLSANFELSEFTEDKDLQMEVSPNVLQLELVHSLVDNILQPLRDEMKTGIFVTSGMRSKEMIEELKSRGYAVSAKTDHSYADPEVYVWGRGAGDIVVADVSKLQQAYLWLKNTLGPKNVIGQIIYYRPEKGKSGFIHVSNSWRVFADALVKVKGNEKLPYLVRKDGVYSIFNSERDF